MRPLIFFCFFLVFCSGAPGRADNFLTPSPDYSAREVVEIQLLGLQVAGTDRRAGITQVWYFAHPENQAVTGPLQRFSRLFDLPAYAPLIGLRDYAITDSQSGAGQARFAVSIRASDGAGYSYIWQLRRTADSKGAGVWMTTSVSAPSFGGAS